jgi:ubiquinone/menaquinone biosynthesis C-methylase UbiE
VTSAPEHPQKAHFAALFDRAADTYDAVGVDFFEPLAQAIVARAGLIPGMHVLDLGCGSGASLRAAAQFVGLSGAVHGVDISPGMVERTRREVSDLPSVSVSVGDADNPPVRPGGWDAVIASLLLFYLPDPGASAARMRGVLRSGGVLAASTFDGPDERWRIVEGAISPYWPPTEGPSHPSASSPFATVASTEGLLRAAGFADIDTQVIEHVNVYADVDHWLEWTWSAGARGMWERVPAADLEAAQQAACTVVSSLAEPDGSLRETFRIRLTRASAP